MLFDVYNNFGGRILNLEKMFLWFSTYLDKYNKLTEELMTRIGPLSIY